MLISKNRFKLIHDQGIFRKTQIIVDLETGVNYLCILANKGCSITPLLDKNGNIVISSTNELDIKKNKKEI